MAFEEPRVKLLDAALVLEDIPARAGILADIRLCDVPERIPALDDVDLLYEDGVPSIGLRTASPREEDRRTCDDSACNGGFPVTRL